MLALTRGHHRSWPWNSEMYPGSSQISMSHTQPSQAPSNNFNTIRPRLSPMLAGMEEINYLRKLRPCLAETISDYNRDCPARSFRTVTLHHSMNVRVQAAPFLFAYLLHSVLTPAPMSPCDASPPRPRVRRGIQHSLQYPYQRVPPPPTHAAPHWCMRTRRQHQERCPPASVRAAHPTCHLSH